MDIRDIDKTIIKTMTNNKIVNLPTLLYGSLEIISEEIFSKNTPGSIANIGTTNVNVNINEDREKINPITRPK